MKNTMMPKLLAITLLSTITFGCANNGNQTEQATTSTSVTEQSTELEKVGYSIGYMMAEGNKEMVDDLNLDTFEMGFRDGYTGEKAALTEEQMEEVVMSYQERKQKEMMEKAQEAAKVNKTEGEAFLAENAQKEGIKTTESGLQYKVVKEGSGDPITDTDMVKVNYEGKLLDDTVFDSSYERGEPVVFPVQGMIPGFTEGLKLMREGSEFMLYIPADLAYGETGNPEIEPNSTLIFKVEVLEVNPEAPAEAPAQ